MGINENIFRAIFDEGSLSVLVLACGKLPEEITSSSEYSLKGPIVEENMDSIHSVD